MQRFIVPLLSFFLVHLAGPAGARAPSVGPPRLVGDVERVPSPSDAFPHQLTRIGDLVYFVARDPARGEALWRTDGTAAGTELVADPCAGGCSVGGLGALTAAGDRLFFTVAPRGVDSLSREIVDLWVTDGTPGSARRLRRFQSVYAGTQQPGLAWLTPLGDGALFLATDLVRGPHLWVTDGTIQGTVPILDACREDCYDLPSDFLSLGDRVAFLWADPDHSLVQQLWLTDGTAEGTRPVTDGLGATGEAGLFVREDRLLFLAGTNDAERTLALWAFNFGDDSLHRLTELPPDDDPWPPVQASPSHFVEAGSQEAYLVLRRPPGEARVWRTDGTAEGTVLAEEILSAGRTGLPERMTLAGETLFFLVVAGDSETLDQAPRPIQVLRAGDLQAHELPGDLRVSLCCGPVGATLGDRLVLSGTVSPSGLWITDGTGPGTQRLGAHGPELTFFWPPEIATLGDRLVFRTDDGTHGQELWRTDGTAHGTALVTDLAPPNASSDPRQLAVVGQDLYFLADEHGGEPALWHQPPDGDPLELVQAQTPYDFLVTSGSRLFLLDYGAVNSFGYDTVAILDPDRSHITPLPGLGRVSNPVPTPGGRLFYAQKDELWIAAPTGSPPEELYDEGPGDGTRDLPIQNGAPPIPYGLVLSGDTLFFVGAGPEGYELWTSDGSAVGTTRVAGPFDYLSSPVAFRDGLLFSASEPGSFVSEPPALWWSDGTTTGTRRLFEGYVGRLAASDRLAFFFTVEEGGALRLRRTDGTVAGTSAVADLGASGLVNQPGELATLGGRLYFTLYTRELGDELWTSDGTAAGTHPVRDLHPGPADAAPSHLTAVGGLLAFAADDGRSGREPWITDGSLAGTIPIADLNPGGAPSGPTAFARAENTVWFAADDGTVGRELWSVQLGASGEQVPPIPPEATALQPAELPGYRVWVLITANGIVQPSRREPSCLPETLCLSGAIPGRSELFLRIVGPKPNGYLWPTLVRFSTSTIDVWIEQMATGVRQYYRLDGVSPDTSSLSGLFDRRGFTP